MNSDTLFLRTHFGTYYQDVVRSLDQLPTRTIVDVCVNNRDIVDDVMFTIFHPTIMGDILNEI